MPTTTNNLDAAVNALTESGLHQDAVETKTKTLARLYQTLAKVNDKPARAYFVPGRIEVLGKHVDYAGGQSLTCATEQGFCVVAAPRDDWRVRLIEPVQLLEASFPLDPELEPFTGDWTNYPMTVARRVARNFLPNHKGRHAGCDIVFNSDLPQAAGLSSSSAMIIGLFLAIAEVNRLGQLPEFKQEIHSDLDMAGYLGCVENGSSFGDLAGDRGVGTKGGSQDHTAILCARANMIGRFNYRPVELVQRTPLPEGYIFAIGVSGVHSQKTANTREQYNRASELAAEAARIWREHTGRNDEHLAAAATSSPDAQDQLRKLIVDADKPLRQRVEQFLDENYRIVPGACEALEAGDMQTFGSLTDDSQRGAELKLGNQVPQTVYLADSARKHGAVAASAFGAGFGGSVWALIHEDQTDAFLSDWSADYRKAFPVESKNAGFITTRPAPPAMRLG